MRKTFLFILALCATTLAWGTTVTKTAKQIANGKWANKAAYASAKLDDVITITVTPGDGDNKNGVYYTGDYTDTHDWRMYQARANGQFTISAAQGYVITSVTLTYEVTNTGVVSTAVKESGVATPDANQILSGTAYPFANSELTFYVGNTTAATDNGQARIRKFSVTYEKGIYDDFRDPTTGEFLKYATAIESVTTQCFTWTTYKCRFNTDAMDILADKTPSNTMWKSNGSYLQTKAVEGGVKTIYFPWNQAKADESKKGTETVKVTVDTKNQSQSREGKAADSRGADSKFSFACNVKKNADVKIEIAAGNRITVGPITIVPYLRYTTKAVEVTIPGNAESATYTNEDLIDNRDDETAIAYSIIGEKNGVAEINAATGEVTGKKAGKVTIQAKWGDVTTTYELTIKECPTPSINGFEGATTDLNGSFAPQVTVLLGEEVITSSATVNYTSNNEDVVSVVDGAFTIVGLGTAKITATVEATETYKSFSKEVNVTVNNVDPAEGTFWKETFNSLGNLSDYQGKSDVVGDYGVSWILRNFRHKTSDATDKVNGEYGVRLKYNAKSDNRDAYIETNSLEGGVKRVQFKWRTPADAENPKFTVEFDNNATVYTVDQAQTAGKAGTLYECGFNANIAKNAKFTIRVTSGTCVSIFGPLTITPYLLYTTKTLTVKLANVQSMGITNIDLINNTNGVGTIKYSVPESNEVATINPTTGELSIAAAGEVIVTAAWDPEGGDNYTVTTTYKLIVNDRSHREAKFASPQVTMKQGEDLPDNELTYAKASGESITINYASSDNTVAEIVNNKVVVRGVGMTTITATIEQTEDFYEDKVSYLLMVYPAESEGIREESYTNAPTGGAKTTRDSFPSSFDDDINWYYRNGRSRTTGDNPDILISGIRGFMLTNSNSGASYLELTKTEAMFTGGIKDVYFDWRQYTADDNGDSLKLQIKINNNPVDTIATLLCQELYEASAQKFVISLKQTKPVKLTFANVSTKDGVDADGRIMMGPITIVPYLFYTTKSHKIDVVKGDAPTWTNTDLINNTEGDGTIVYSVLEGNGVATIDPESGEVTAEGNGITTVTATWTPADPEDGEVVATTYTLEVFAERLDAELTFDPEEITVGVNETTVTTPTLGNPHELTVKYSSSDEDIATVDETTGEVTLKGVDGDVVISATSEETDTYKEGSASYTIHVLLLTSEVTFPDLTDNEKTVNMDADPFTENISVKVNGEEVSKPTITYESSNENAARVNETTGEVTIISVGTTVITATVAPTETYAGTTAGYTLKVEKGNIGDAWVEGFGVIEQKSNYIEQDMSVRGDSLNENDRSVYTWKIENYQRNTETADKVGEDLGIRLRARDKDKKMHDNHIMFDGVQEGGIKAIAFDWRLPGSGTASSVQYDVIVNGETTHFDYKNVEAGYGEGNNKYPYAQFFGVRKNTTLTISIPQNEVNQAVIFGPIKITPYLLYTKKVVEVNASEETSYTYPADKLINNTGSEGAITYSMTSNTGAAINANTGEVDLTSVTVAGDETITATWGEVSTTFTLKVTAKTPDFTLENKTAGAFATICLPKKIDHVENATLWSINYGDKTSIEFVEAEFENDDAGMPYLVQVAADGNVNFYYGEGDAVTEPVSAEEAKGFVGSLQEENQEVPFDGTAILVSGGQLHIAGTNCVLTQNHAYIDATKLPTEPEPVGAPRKTIRLYNPEAQVPTNFNGLNGAVKPMKVLRDGQFYIIRDTKTYNAQGILVE